MTKDIFNTADLSDLPAKMQRDLTKSTRVSPYLTLFRLANSPLTATEIAVGMYRQFGKVKTVQSCRTALSQMKKRGQLVRVAHGQYALSDSLTKAAE